jgi:hypothetical protein
MNNLMLMPLVESGAAEEAQNQYAQGVQLLPAPRNYATDTNLQPFFRDLNDLMEAVRLERAPLHEEWEAIRRMNLMIHDSGRSYFGRSQAYLPVYRRQRQTLISNTSRGLFPSDEYLDVTLLSDQSGDPELAKPHKLYMQWEVDVNARLRTLIKPFIASFFDYGTAIFKTWYKKEIMQVGGPGVVQRSLLGSGYTADYRMRPTCVMDGLAVSARNLFNWYIYPATCESARDAMLIFEDIDIGIAYVRDMVRKKRWIPDAEKFFDEHVQENLARQELLGTRGYGSDTNARQSGPFAQRGTATEVWTFAVLPPSAYVMGEDTKAPVPCRLVFINGMCVEATRNMSFHQQHPYHVARHDWEAGFFYGVGAGRTVRPLQYLSNDFVNQTNDVGNYGLNPIAKINPGLMVGPPKPLRPGVPIYTTDVDKGIAFDRPPIEQVGHGMNMVNMFMQMAENFGGTPPIMQGNPRGAKTATQTQILQKNAQVPMQDIAEDIENDVFVPMMRQAYKNAQQFRDDDVMVAVAGQSIKVSLDQLAMDAQFRWLASSQAVNNQVRAQQAIQLIQAVLPTLPILMQQGYVVDFVALIRRIFVDGFGYRGFSEFIRRAQAAPMGPGMQPGMPGAAPRPDQMAGVKQEQGDRIRSALEQVYGRGETEAVPGEGGDFMDVRSQTESMTGGMA